LNAVTMMTSSHSVENTISCTPALLNLNNDLIGSKNGMTVFAADFFKTINILES